MRERAAALLLSAVAVSGCAGSATTSQPVTRASEPPGTTTAPEPSLREVALVATPVDALATCRSSRALRNACPRLVPEAPYEERPEVFVAEVLQAGRGSPEMFNLQWGAENPGRPERNRPPRLSHVVVVAAAWGGALSGVEARVLRRADWSGREGTLLRAAAFPRGGLHGDHLVFRWRKGGREYAASLHVWEPLRETVEALEAIVASMPGP